MTSPAAATTVTRLQLLILYRHLLRSSSRFVDYNFREYALRVVKDDFRKHRNESDQDKVQELYQYGIEQLGVINRQVMMNHLYAQKLSIMDMGGSMDGINNRGRNVQEDDDEED